jgi:hypothetical protein
VLVLDPAYVVVNVNCVPELTLRTVYVTSGVAVKMINDPFKMVEVSVVVTVAELCVTEKLRVVEVLD